MADKETKEILGVILESLNEQNKILPALVVKVDMMWKIFWLVLCTAIVGFCGAVGVIMSKGWS